MLMFKGIIVFLLISVGGIFVFYLALNKKGVKGTEAIINSVDELDEQPSKIRSIIILYIITFFIMMVNFILGFLILGFSLFFLYRFLMKKLTVEDRGKYVNNITSIIESVKYNTNTLKFAYNKASGKENKSYLEFKKHYIENNYTANLFPNFNNNTSTTTRSIKKSYNALYEDKKVEPPNKKISILTAELKALIHNWADTKILKDLYKIKTSTDFGSAVDCDINSDIESFIIKLKSKQDEIKLKYQEIIKELNLLKTKDIEKYNEYQQILKTLITEYNEKYLEVKELQDNLLVYYKGGDING